MKKVITILLVLCIALLGISCAKKEEPASVPQAGQIDKPTGEPALGEQPAAQQPAEQAAQQPAEQPAEQPAAQQPAEPAAQQPADQAAQQPAQPQGK